VEEGMLLISYGKESKSMEIEWISGLHKEDSMIFDSEFEAYEWADGLHSDIVPYLWEKVNVGYETPDKKVYTNLLNLLPKWIKEIDVKFNIYNDEIEVDGQVIYKIWAIINGY
jgi:hypothetical protein